MIFLRFLITRFWTGGGRRRKSKLGCERNTENVLIKIMRILASGKCFELRSKMHKNVFLSAVDSLQINGFPGQRLAAHHKIHEFHNHTKLDDVFALDPMKSQWTAGIWRINRHRREATFNSIFMSVSRSEIFLSSRGIPLSGCEERLRRSCRVTEGEKAVLTERYHVVYFVYRSMRDPLSSVINRSLTARKCSCISLPKYVPSFMELILNYTPWWRHTADGRDRAVIWYWVSWTKKKSTNKRLENRGASRGNDGPSEKWELKLIIYCGIY